MLVLRPDDIRSSSERLAKLPERSAKSPERSAKSPERSAKSPERSAKSPERSAKSPERSTIVIRAIGGIGAGTMGNGIAQVFAQAGFSVRLIDVAEPMLSRAQKSIEKSLAKLVDKGKLTADARDQTMHRLSTSTALDRLGDA